MSFSIVKLVDSLSPTIITGGLVPRGAYDNGTNYAVGDSVDYNGSSYVMFLDAGAGTLPTNTTYWQVVASKGDTGSTGATGATGSTGSAGNDGADGVDGAISTIQDEGTPLTVRPYLNFIGDAVTVTDDSGNNRTNITISGGALKVNTITSSATPSINTDTTDLFTITALATAITSFTTNLSGTPTTGQKLQIRILDNGTARSITHGASFASRGVTLPTTTVISKYLRELFEWNEVTNTWDLIAVSQE
jgi:hypothetical protein